MNIDNIWFYTLSTSAQVLSALAGLFAVFVVWKVQDIEKSLFEIRLGIIRIIHELSLNIQDFNPIKRKDLYLFKDEEILKQFSELLLIKNEKPERIKAIIPVFTTENLVSYSLDDFTECIYKSYIDKKSSILESLKNVLILNFTVISACILCLTFSSLIEKKFLILIIISTCVLVCLYSISRSIYKITIK